MADDVRGSLVMMTAAKPYWSRNHKGPPTSCVLLCTAIPRGGMKRQSRDVMRDTAVDRSRMCMCALLHVDRGGMFLDGVR